MQVLEVAVKDRQGLHARACARLVRVANRFRCDIALIARGRRASAVSEIAALFDAGPGGPA